MARAAYAPRRSGKGKLDIIHAARWMNNAIITSTLPRKAPTSRAARATPRDKAALSRQRVLMRRRL